MKKLSVFFMLAILFLCPLVTFACSHTCEFGEWQLTKEATCTEDGIERRYCIHNNTHFEERPIDAIGHEFGEWTTIITPTCGNTGLKKRTQTIF